MFISKELLLTSVSDFNIVLSDKQIDKFDLFARELVKYNEKVNLTAITNPDGIVIKHFADSLALFKFVNINKGDSFIDVGSGAGFPAVPLLINCPEIKMTVIDSVNKKLDFIRYAVSLLELETMIVHIRAEDAGKSKEFREKFDFASARAVAQLRILSELCLPFVKTDGLFLAMKGSISDEEKTAGIMSFKKLNSQLYDDINYKIPNGDERNLIIAKKISRVSSKYPRNMGQISKNPL